jgi:hypothetical protein
MKVLATAKCEWHGCESTASRFLTLGDRVFDAPDTEGKHPKQKSLALCDQHAGVARQTYFRVVENQLTLVNR